MPRRAISEALSLGSVTQDDFNVLTDFFGDRTTYDSRYFADTGKVYNPVRHNGKDILVIPGEIISPFVDASEDWLMLGAFTRISYQRSVVYPGERQRSGPVKPWHFDTNEANRLRAVIFSDTLPPLVVNGSTATPDVKTGYGGELNHRHVLKMLAKGSLTMQEGLAPFHAIGIDESTLHASAENELEVPIERTFFRISTIRHSSVVDEIKADIEAQVDAGHFS